MPPETPLEAQNKPQKSKDMSWKTFFLYVCLVVIIRLFIIEPHSVSGSSMTETFHDKDYLFVEKISYRFTHPQRGDIVVFNPPLAERSKDRFIKRVIGIPGDSVRVTSEGTFVNGELVNEPFVDHPGAQTAEVKLKEEEYFVMGDNRAGSYDSRSWGPVREREIQGKVLLRLYPFSDITLYPGYVK